MSISKKNIKSSISAFEIDKLLPQTQCKECGFNGCLPYAQALAQKVAPINLCAPGGEETIIKLSDLLNINHEQYINSHTTKMPSVAIIKEKECIGCTKCISACPVDAIIGSSKKMHSVLSHECTGCGLCIEPCPVDCIEMHELTENNYDKNLARKRYQAKSVRKLKQEHEKAKLYREKTSYIKNTDEKKAYILEALKRTKNAKSPTF